MNPKEQNNSNENTKAFVVKKHIYMHKLILAVCDKELLGKKFEQDNKVLDLTSSFYKGELMNQEEVLDLMNKAYILNLIGEASVKLALNNNLISERLVFKVKNIPYAQSIRNEKV